jgi:hypothetical protein
LLKVVARPLAQYHPYMPRWLLPWIVPLAVAAVVVLDAISSIAATIALALLAVASFVGLAAMRVQHLKDHPPDPELARKPFWRF